jgi:hypothetical protein
MLFGETVAVYCENHTEHTNTLCGQNAEFYVLKQAVHIVTAGLYMVNVIRDQASHTFTGPKVQSTHGDLFGDAVG